MAQTVQMALAWAGLVRVAPVQTGSLATRVALPGEAAYTMLET